MSMKNARRAIADPALAAVEEVRQRPAISAAMRADGALAGKMQAAARAAADSETKRCVDVVELCAKLGQPDQALAAIKSGKAPAEVEAELRKKAVAAGWDRAISNGQPSQEGVAGWNAAVAKVNGQS